MDYTLIGGPVERTLSLQGAPMRWRSEAGRSDLYVPGVRVVGTEAAVRAWLTEHTHDLALLDTAFRAGDQATQRYKDAVKAARPPTVPKTKALPPPSAGRMRSPLRIVRQFNERIDLDKPIKLRNHRNEEKTSPCKSVLLRRVRPDDAPEDPAPSVMPKYLTALQKRMADLPPQKVLDVSAYDFHTGKGARICPRPGPRDLTRRGLPDIPLVSRTGEPLRKLLALLGMPSRVAEVTW